MMLYQEENVLMTPFFLVKTLRFTVKHKLAQELYI